MLKMNTIIIEKYLLILLEYVHIGLSVNEHTINTINCPPFPNKLGLTHIWLMAYFGNFSSISGFPPHILGQFCLLPKLKKDQADFRALLL
jgi:hypothetical protein